MFQLTTVIMLSLSSPAVTLSKRIERWHTQMVKIPNIPRDHSEPVHDGHRCNHGVLQQRIRPSVHHSGPLPKRRRVYRKYLVRVQHQSQPPIQFLCFRRVLLARYLDPRLNLADGHCAQVQVLFRYTLNPGNHRWMRPGASQF